MAEQRNVKRVLEQRCIGYQYTGGYQTHTVYESVVLFDDDTTETRWMRIDDENPPGQPSYLTQCPRVDVLAPDLRPKWF